MKKQNKTNKKLASAAAMLMLSTAMLGMATYAWFTMNKEVSVTGMKIEATASKGLVISGDNKATWQTDWDVAMTAGVKIYPTSTSGDPMEWAVAYSKVFNDAYKNQEQTDAGGYTDLSMSYDSSLASGTTFTSGLDGVGQATPSGSDSAQNYVLKKTFFIKSTGDTSLGKRLRIKEVKATNTVNAGSGSADLNRALRVLVVVGNNGYIYAPITGYDNSTKFKGTTALTYIGSTTATNTSVTSIPNTNDGAIQVDMYMYYEGEDQNCKSSNITGISVDTLNISAKFDYVDIN